MRTANNHLCKNILGRATASRIHGEKCIKMYIYIFKPISKSRRAKDLSRKQQCILTRLKVTAMHVEYHTEIY